MKDKVIDLWRSSAIVQGLMALAGFGSICYLAITQQPIPELLAALVGTMVGFYFGTKTKQQL